MKNIERRDFIKKTVFGSLGTMLSMEAMANKSPDEISNEDVPVKKIGATKKIIVGGGGISGLCCAYELMKKGHEVVVLEAAGRYGGSVLTVHDGLADGLYADFGAENFTKPGYANYWKYVEEFKLPVLPYHHQEKRLTFQDGQWTTVQMQEEKRQQRAKELGGFNTRELKFLSENPSRDLEHLYLSPYFEKFKNEYQPFGIGYDNLETVTAADVYKKAGASAAALNELGGEKSSALYSIWQAFIMNKRGYDKTYELFRLKGGNQVMTNEFGRRLGKRVKLDCQISSVRHDTGGVVVNFTESGEQKSEAADFFVSCLRPAALQNISFTPEMPPEKRFVFENIGFVKSARIVFQAKSAFWLDDNLPNINLTYNHPALATIWQVAEEVETHRVCLMAKAPAGTNPLRTLETFKEFYPGKKSNITIEQNLVMDWSKGPYASGCERFGFSGLGELSKYWPHVMTPHGRIHFAGGHTDNRSWGMEAATNSANRVAQEIDQL